MLRAIDDFIGIPITAINGDIGKVTDVYFDDHDWTIRYLVVDTGNWLAARKVLIAPPSIRSLQWDASRLEVDLTRDQVRNNPPVDVDKPVSRQYETSLYDYYGYGYYWAGPYIWGATAFPKYVAGDDTGVSFPERRRRAGRYDPNLRSAHEVTGYHIQALNGSIGHVEDILFDDESFSICYLVVDTRNWLPGNHVLVSVERVERVSWTERSAHVGMTLDAVQASPQFRRELVRLPEDEARVYLRNERRVQRSPSNR